MTVNSMNVGRSFDNTVKKSVRIVRDWDYSVAGSAFPAAFHYNVSQFSPFKSATNETEIGPHLVHIYGVRGTSTSTIEEIEIFIHWPAQTLDNEPLMFLMSQPETYGPMSCDTSQHVNFLYTRKKELKRDDLLQSKSFLDANRLPIRKGDSGPSGNSSLPQSVSNSDGKLDNNKASTGDPSFNKGQLRDSSEINADICQRFKCLNVRCVVGPLETNTTAMVAIRTRLVAHTLHKVNLSNSELRTL